jgi:phosphomannomutase
MACRLEFGTAGLRGVIGAGPNRMNLAVVLETTWGLGTVLAQMVPNAKKRGVIIGYDARNRSREFAEAAAQVLLQLGYQVLLTTREGPTPLLAFAVRHHQAAAGIMVTASHNPPEYNGYKVYWERGAQIISPIDERIAEAILSAPSPAVLAAAAPSAIAALPESTVEAYQTGVLALVQDAFEGKLASNDHALRGGRAGLRVVYTPLHGVGAETMLRVLGAAGFDSVRPVTEQVKPDGGFPTVKFPNPEEKGAMDLAYAHAKAFSAELVIANDPDADRLSVAIPTVDAAGFEQLTGNQVGVLLGHCMMHHKKELGGEEAGKKLAVLASCVSSPMLGAIARQEGFHYEETLTGFKWIANRGMDLEAEGTKFLFGYEEALGYCPGSLVKDKDGISAALLFAEFAARCKFAGTTVRAALEELYTRYGCYESAQLNLTRKGATGKQEIAGIMQSLREKPLASIGGKQVLAMSDAEQGTRTVFAPGGEGTKTALGFPKSNVLFFELEGGSRMIARPSGTEPKLKFYFDVCVPVQGTLREARAEAAALIEKMKQEIETRVSAG